MSRLRGLPPDTLDPEQRALYDEIVASRRGGGTFDLFATGGALAGPFNAMVYAPALGRHWSAIGARLRFDSVLDQRLVELVICTVGAYYQADFEFQAHAPLALRAGVGEGVLDALRQGDTPSFDRDDERIVHDLAGRLLRAEHIGSDVYTAAEAVLGEGGMVELASLVGYYAALAIGLNLFAVGPPTGNEPIWGSAR
ncbi:MAG TPA: carboxymuconolactone decarboxylase family protein [Ilumatobacter sp.]|nr:carboxymuconolactone decarboxylase family protein [Ilumatobacter sp.]